MSFLWEKDASYWITRLNLRPVPDPAKSACTGYIGYLHESAMAMAMDCEKRPAVSSIYFLQLRGQRGLLHMLKSDEVLCHHAGGALEVNWLDFEAPGQRVTKVLGRGEEQQLQVVVPAGKFMCFKVPPTEEEGGFCLFSVVVATAFVPEVDEKGDREELLRLYPEQAEFIKEFT